MTRQDNAPVHLATFSPCHAALPPSHQDTDWRLTVRQYRLSASAALILAAFAVVPVHADTTVTLGQQLLYTGTLTLKQTSQGRAVEVSGPIKLDAVVTEA